MTNGSDRSDGHPLARGVPAWRRRSVGADRARDPSAHSWVETDGGTAGGDEAAFATYTDEEYGYTVSYPADWSAGVDAGGGATFEDPASTAGAVVFVDENVERDVAAYAERFEAELAADDHVHDVERLDRRTVWLPSGHRGRAVEYRYVGGAPDERWRLTYLFVVAGTAGYTVGVDWAADIDFEAVAWTVVESFSLTPDSTE
ncbi:hypothetical protein [Halococcus agarilyticus]|uniref:hypothetical protein n=1 Tax=Halococcus agarilyticus TaxID=1232219 RepID=UPI0006778F9D|nr:hypothetical protein [Halococcus agarilyticus]